MDIISTVLDKVLFSFAFSTFVWEIFSMNLLVDKKYSAAVEVFKENISLLEREKDNAVGGDIALVHSTLDTTIAVLHCNIALAEYGMGLYRKCIKSCAMAIKRDPTNISACHVEGKAYMSMGKRGHAQATWQEGLAAVTDFTDACVVMGLVDSLAALKESDTNASSPFLPPPPSPPSPPAPTPTPAVRTPTSAAVPTFSTPSASTNPSPIPPPPPVTSGGGAAEAIAALGGKERRVEYQHLQIIENHFIGLAPNQIHPDVIKAASRSVVNACGEKTVDNLISMGYLLVNNSKLREAIELFTTLLQYRPDLLAAFLGLGSCWALTGRMIEAVQAFSSAIELNPQCADAWKRRGQTRAAIGLLDEGLADLKAALSLGHDNDIHFHIGSTLHQKKHFQEALLSFRSYRTSGGEETGKLFNYLGMCHSQLGDVNVALQFFNQAISVDPCLIEATINCAQMLKECGRGDDADDAFDNVMRWYNTRRSQAFSKLQEQEQQESGGIDMSRQVFLHRGSLQYSMGNYMEALGYLRRYLGEEPKSEHGSLEDPLSRDDRVSALVKSALCLQNLGQFSEALDFFDDALSLSPGSSCVAQKQLLLYNVKQLDNGLDEFCVDVDFSAHWKESSCKYNSTATLLQHAPFDDFDENAENDEAGELNPSYEMGAETKRIVDIGCTLAPWVQLNTPGFLVNCRQHKSFGLAALQMAKRLDQHCEAIINEADIELSAPSSECKKSETCRLRRGLLVADCGSSGSLEGGQGCHTFMFRDFFDIAVKWRQISEPNDPVWWIDRLTKKSFDEGFGLHTPMVNGELKCIRYYPYYDMGFSLLKKVLISPGGVHYTARGESHRSLPRAKREAIASAAGLEEVYAAIGEDFWVVCPCKSSIHNEVLLEGTRLTLCKKRALGEGESESESGRAGGDEGRGRDAEYNVGFDFSIRTPGLPARWVAMEAELTACFESIVKQVVLLKRMDRMEQDTPNSHSLRDTTLTRLTQEALRLFYFWVNFAPLTRGSAVCGYAAIMAVLLAGGRTINIPLPAGKQLDWEAIFTSNANEFIANFEDCMGTVPSDFSLTDEVDFDTGMPSLYDALQCLRFT